MHRNVVKGGVGWGVGRGRGVVVNKWLCLLTGETFEFVRWCVKLPLLPPALHNKGGGNADISVGALNCSLGSYTCFLHN